MEPNTAIQSIRLVVSKPTGIKIVLPLTISID
jgi:hypothetical protein